MAASRKRARQGDIIEVKTSRGLAYAQYCAKHPKYGDAIRVLPGFFHARPKDWRALLSQEGYFTFYPVGAAVSQGLVELVASLPVPAGHELPSTYRRAGWRTPEGKVTAWLICDGAKEVLRTELTADEKRLFIAAIWNHEFLVERLVAEWRPEQEPPVHITAQTQPASPRSPQTPGSDAPRRVTHYLYFPTTETGERVAAMLRARGFEVESRHGADEKNWLVLVSHMTRPGEELQGARDTLEQLAEQHMGSYDGSQVAV
jgi:hypothetical protein